MKFTASLVLFLFLVITTANSQEPVITMATTKTIGSSFSFSLAAKTDNTIIQVNFGDGNLIDKTIGTTVTSVSGNLGTSRVVKIYGAEVTYLDCNNIKLSSLDVTKCTTLNKLWCYNNQITTLDVTKCTLLTSLRCYYNLLTTLNVTQCKALTELHVGYNQIAALDVTQCKSLKLLGCHDLLLTELNITNCPLTYLRCYNNKFTFASLPIKKAPLTTYNYAGQLPMVIPTNYSTGIVDLSSQAVTNGNATNYTWKTESGAILVEGSDYSITGGITTFLKKQTEKVYCEMTNATFPDLTGVNVFKTTSTKVLATQTITFNAIPVKKANDSPFALTASASSGLAVSFTSSDPSIASINGSTVTIHKAGSVTIYANQAGDDAWVSATTVTQTLTIGKQSQTITFNELPVKMSNDNPFTLAASASSGLAVTYTSADPSIASISGSTVTIHKAGTVTIYANQAGNDIWVSATTVTQTLTIGKQSQTITFNELPVKKANDSPFTLTASASSELAVTYTSADPSIASISGSTVTIHKAGTVNIYANQAGNDIWASASAITQKLVITNKEIQTITFDPLPNKNINDTPFELCAKVNSNLPITFSSSDPAIASINGTTVTIHATGSVTINAFQPGDDTWEAATTSQTLTISSVTGFKETEEQKLIISPNPVCDILYIKGTVIENANASIYNLSGVKVCNEVVNQQCVNVSKLSAGVYILKISCKGKKDITTRFLKQ